jgi:hypothetical protein
MSEHGHEHGGAAVAESHGHDAGHEHAPAPDLRFEKEELHEFEAEDRDAGRHIGLLLAAVFCIGLGLALGVTVWTSFNHAVGHDPQAIPAASEPGEHH